MWHFSILHEFFFFFPPQPVSSTSSPVRPFPTFASLPFNKLSEGMWSWAVLIVFPVQMRQESWCYIAFWSIEAAGCETALSVLWWISPWMIVKCFWKMGALERSFCFLNFERLTSKLYVYSWCFIKLQVIAVLEMFRCEVISHILGVRQTHRATKWTHKARCIIKSCFL